MKRVFKILIPIIIITLLIVIVAMLIMNIKSNANDIEKNKNSITDSKKIDNLIFDNTSLNYKDGMSTFETNVTNIGNDTEYLTEVKIHIKNKKNKEIMVLTGFVGDNIKSGESKIITSTYGQKLNDAYSVEYEIIK